MFLLALIAAPVLELFVFVEVARTIGWLLAVFLLLATSILGVQAVRIQGRSAIERLSVAVSQRRAPARAAIDGALGFLGALLLVVPGFITDAAGALLLFAPTRALAQRWISRHYAARVIDLAASAARFAPGRSRARGADRAPRMRPADVESTAVEDHLDELDP